MKIKEFLTIRAILILATFLLGFSFSASAAQQQPGFGLGRALKNGLGHLLTPGGRMAIETEHDNLMFAVEQLFRESRLDADALGRGSEVVVYCVTGQTRKLSTVMVFEQTRRGLSLKELTRAGNVVFSGGRRRVSRVRAATELNYARNVELPHTSELIQVRHA